MMDVVKRVSGMSFRLGGEEHSGWLPPGAAVPLPAPIHNVLMDIEIQSDGHGYLLCYSSQDGSMCGDTWHETLADAEQTAEEQFGVTAEQWRLL
jgi:hypothetical protein